MKYMQTRVCARINDAGILIPNMLIASFQISLRIAKTNEPHINEDNLKLLKVKDTVEVRPILVHRDTKSLACAPHGQ